MLFHLDLLRQSLPLRRLCLQYQSDPLVQLDPSDRLDRLGRLGRLGLESLYSGILDSTCHNPYIDIFHLYYNSYIHIPFNSRLCRTFII